MTSAPLDSRPFRRRAASAWSRGIVGVGLGVLLWQLASCDDDDPVRPAALAPALETFREPPEVRSAGGVLQKALAIGPATVQVAGQDVQATVYDGLYVPPTLRVRPGDVMRLSLANGGGLSTNLHTHGLGVSPLANSDNVFLAVAPGATQDYEIRIPGNHPAGLFWYHPHFHGVSSASVKQGLSGAIIVEGLLDPFPELRGIRERVLLLKDAQIAGGTIDTTLDIGDNTTRTVNGLDNPTLLIRPGETQLWRIGNIGANIYYRLSLGGHRFHVVARDGNRLARMVETEELLLPPGSRAEVLVQGGDVGAHQLRTAPITTGAQGDSYAGAVLATLLVAGEEARRITLPTVLDPAVVDLRGRVTNRRTVTFSETDDGLTFFIDGRTFDHDRVDTQVRVGDVEEWTIRNVTGEWHAFHIHQGDFQIVSVNGQERPFDGYHDTAHLPDNSEVKIVIPFTDPVAVGKFVYHCHILDHEDNGMMAVIEVQPANAVRGVRAAAPAPSHAHGSAHAPRERRP